MNEYLKLKEFQFFKKDVLPLESKIPIVNFSLFENIFSHLISSNSYSNLDNLHVKLLSQDDFNYIKLKIKTVQSQIYIKTLTSFCLGNFILNYLIFNPIQRYFLSTARSFSYYKRFKFVMVPFFSSLISYEFSKGLSIDLNSFLPCSHIYYNLVYFDVYFKRDLLDFKNINTLDHKKFSDSSFILN